MATQRLAVVCGIIKNQANKILVSLRAPDKEQGGLWEFPGGKVESGEGLVDALRRELNEELGILVKEAVFLTRVSHDYKKYHVTLHVFQVVSYDLEPVGREGQLIHWVDSNTLKTLDFPAANYPIITALARVFN